MKKTDNIENIFNSKFEGFTPQISEELINKIKLAADKKAKSVRLKKVYKTSFVLGTIGVLLGLVYYSNVLSSNNTELETVEKIEASKTLSLPTEKTETNIEEESLDLWETPIVELTVKNNDIDSENRTEAADEFKVENNSITTENEIVTGENEDVKPKKIVHSNNIFPRYPNTPLGRALYSVDRFKNGALLVRLKTRVNAIKACEERGYIGKANQIKEEQLIENRRLMKLFKENFKFCQVYFFYSTDSKNIRDSNVNGIFLNSEMVKDSNIILSSNFFLVADIGQAKATSLGMGKQKEVLENTGSLSRLLVIQDDQFYQMESPFPYYQKALIKERDAKNITKLSEKIERFYNERK